MGIYDVFSSADAKGYLHTFTEAVPYRNPVECSDDFECPLHRWQTGDSDTAKKREGNTVCLFETFGISRYYLSEEDIQRVVGLIRETADKVRACGFQLAKKVSKLCMASPDRQCRANVRRHLCYMGELWYIEFAYKDGRTDSSSSVPSFGEIAARAGTLENGMKDIYTVL